MREETHQKRKDKWEIDRSWKRVTLAERCRFLRLSEEMSPEQIAEKMRRELRTVKKHIKLAIEQNEKAKDKEARQGAVAQTYIEQWRDLTDMSRRIINTLVIPSPRSFFVFELEAGSYWETSGCGFNWSCSPDGQEIRVSFVDLENDMSLEDWTFFNPLMEHLSEVKTEFQKLKALTGDYIKKCH